MRRFVFVIIILSLVSSSALSRENKVTNKLGMEFVLIKPGSYMLGSPASEPMRDDDEDQHQVTLTTGFYLQATEVTQGQCLAIMENNPSYFDDCGKDCPVEQVAWNDVQEFISKLNMQDKARTYRLPTEAEWEYACRAGSTTSYSFGQDMSIVGQFGNVCDINCEAGWKESSLDDGYKNTAPVKSFKPNKWNLYDMHGNVWEWCQDWKDSYPRISVSDPTGPETGKSKILRGGGCVFDAKFCRSANRYANLPTIKYRNLGFRLVFTEKKF